MMALYYNLQVCIPSYLTLAPIIITVVLNVPLCRHWEADGTLLYCI